MSHVACVGIAVLDHVFQVAELPSSPGKYRATARTETGGGVAANAAATVTRLGGTAGFHGAVGDDSAADRITAGLEAWGVDTSGVRRVPGQASPVSAVLVDAAGERLIVNHAGPELFTVAPSVTASDVAEADVVLADMRWPGGAIPALRAARGAGKPAIVDCDHDPADAPGILEAATHIVFALATLQRYAGNADAAAATGVRAAPAPVHRSATMRVTPTHSAWNCNRALPLQTCPDRHSSLRHSRHPPYGAPSGGRASTGVFASRGATRAR